MRQYAVMPIFMRNKYAHVHRVLMGRGLIIKKALVIILIKSVEIKFPNYFGKTFVRLGNWSLEKQTAILKNERAFHSWDVKIIIIMSENCINCMYA